MLFMWNLTVLMEMYISLATSAVQHARDVPEHLPFAFGEWLDRQCRGLIWAGWRGRRLGWALSRGEEAPVGVGEHGVMLQHRFEPAALDGEWQP